MATILYRALDATGDPMRGQGQANYLADLDAVTQAISSRIKLLLGEWFENVSLGTPLFQSILGVPQTEAGVALLMNQRIMSLAPYVTRISKINVTYGAGRAFTFSCLVDTVFGQVSVSNT